jgi:hypothetical protein
MNIYTAIMKAADTIEQCPKLYTFQANRVPECGSPGCLIGHIGAQLGHVGQGVYSGETWAMIGLDPDRRYDILDQMGYWDFRFKTDEGRTFARYAVTEHAPLAAAFLRHFALRFKPQHTGLPDIVRDIFTNPRQTISDTAVDQRFA